MAKLVGLGLILAVLVSACADADAFSLSTPAPTATRFVQPTVTRLPIAATQTAEALQPAYVIERLAFALNVEPDGAPAEEVTVIPGDTRNIFFSVLIRGAQPGTIMRAYWFEGNQIIGQSEVELTASDEDPRWVALGFRSPAALNPASPHSVELRINDRKIDTYTFRVGVGAVEDVVAEAFMALGTRDEQIVGEGELFDMLAVQLVAVVRISNKVDPTGMILSAFWYRGDTLIDQGQPDGGQPLLPADPQPLDRRYTFTFAPPGGLTPGEYSAVIMINGAEVRTLPFTIVSEQLPMVTPSSPVRPTATSTAPASGVSIRDVRVVREVDPTTSEPVGNNISRVEASPNEKVELQVATQFSNLRVDDVIEVDILQNGNAYDRYRYPVAAFDSGWMSMTASLEAPDSGDPDNEYVIQIFVNGTRVRTTEVDVEAD